MSDRVYLDGKYDILVSDVVRCSCGMNAHAGEIVWMRGTDGFGYMHCLSCAERFGGGPVPLDIVAKSTRLTRDYFCRAMASALVAGLVVPRAERASDPLAGHDTGLG